MSMGFGKLNTEGGWRRLNVAVTRARSEMVLFTSFDPGMIDLTRTSQKAVADLKRFVEYAERGPRAIAQASRGSVGEAESPFEQAVAGELCQRGWTVATQIGVSRFRIDLGIVHPDRPGDYLVGVECDGATYHSAATARDRDKVRAAILEDLGWRLVRVWSTEWWTNRQRAADKLHTALEAALEADRAARAEGTAAEADAAEGAVEAVVPASATLKLIERPGAESRVDLPQRASPHVDVAADPPASVLIGQAGPPVPGDGRYRFTDFTPVAHLIDPARFYEPDYDDALRSVIEHVLSSEAPIAETPFVQRVARAHQFQRAGRVIRDRVMKLVWGRHHSERDDDGEPFIWLNQGAVSAGVHARFPAGDDHIRQIEHISLAELRVAGSTDPVEIARRFGIRRLSASARARIEQALERV
jgi:very-short-patch-repair endonuclease